MKRPHRTLRFRGLCLELASDGTPAADACVDWLCADFAAWSATEPEARVAAFIRVAIHGTPAPRSAIEGRKVFRTRMAVVRGVGARREIDYGNQSTALLDASRPDRPVVQLHSPCPELLREIAYAACLSLVGERLDGAGFHRVHALGVSVAGRAALCVFGEKSGKSTLAMALKLERVAGLKFFSDETPLLRQGRLHAYPNRLALGDGAERLFAGRLPADARAFTRRLFAEKRLYAFSDDEIAASAPLAVIVLDGGRGAGAPSLTPASPVAALAALGDAMVVGRGVAQMSEYFLRFDPSHLVRLSRIAFSRAAEAAVSVAGASAYRFRRGDDPAENARTLAGFLSAT